MDDESWHVETYAILPQLFRVMLLLYYILPYYLWVKNLICESAEKLTLCDLTIAF